MHKSRTIVTAILSFTILFSFIPTSQAELFDFIIELDMEKNMINSGDTLEVSGRVVDHAYKGSRGIEVVMKTGADSIKAFTDPDGMFKGEFKDLQRNPGTYKIIVIATWYDKTGITSTQFQVNGEVTPVTLLQQKLTTDEAKKYLGSTEGDFEKNPIGQALFKYYHGLLAELYVEQKKMQEPAEDQIFLEQQRKISQELKEQAIEEYNPGSGTHGGINYDNYIRSLNPEIRDLVSNQMNFTKNIFEEAQLVRDGILANGGTYEEARQAYLELITMPKEILEKFNDEQLEKTDESVEENVEDSAEENQPSEE